MSTDRSRAHIVVSEDLLREVDEFVGARRRSEFFAEAAREKINRLKLCRAAEQLAGLLAVKDIPGWESSESAAEWVHSQRRDAEERHRGAGVVH
jgi:metal-responsive CopG/Arc/MetJ family transcriptional regulator